MAKIETDINEIKNYLSKQVNPILEQLMIELIHKKPPRPAEFMKNWLLKEGTVIQRKIHATLNNRPEGINSTSESDASDEEMNSPSYAGSNGIGPHHNSQARAAVSAEVYGEYNSLKDFKPPVFPKNETQYQNILKKIENSVIFSHLKKDDKETIIKAMEIVTFPSHINVITHNDKGDNLYVVDSGTLECYKKDIYGQKQHLITYKSGDAFGELALLYNAPRAATVETETECTLFSLDRSTFNHVVKGSIHSSRKAYMSFLKKVDIFDTLTETEKEMVCDCFKDLHYKDGDYLIREGEDGDTFFCIQKGVCEAFRRNNTTNKNEKVMTYKENDYFGELALLRNTPRAASIVAVGPVDVVCIERAAFKRLFGPLEDILKRNTKKYEAIIAR